MSKQKDLVATVADLKKEGYNHEFSINGGQLFSGRLAKGYGAESFTVDKSYMFGTGEGVNDQDRLYAITLPKENMKGYLVDAYAAIDMLAAPEVREKFGSNNAEIHHTSDAETKYGLPRVKKDSFNLSPSRYVLRIGFPDFPSCPFGNKFEALGWDTQDEKYVWLSTGIIKDSQLVRKHYTDPS